MRVVALIELFVLTIANLVKIFMPVSDGIRSYSSPQTIRRRIEHPEQTGPFFAWHHFKKPAFSVYTLGGILNFLGFYTRTFSCPLPVSSSSD